MSHVRYARVRYVVLVPHFTSQCLPFSRSGACHVATSVAVVAPTKSATTANFSPYVCVCVCV